MNDWLYPTLSSVYLYENQGQHLMAEYRPITYIYLTMKIVGPTDQARWYFDGQTYESGDTARIYYPMPNEYSEQVYLGCSYVTGWEAPIKYVTLRGGGVIVDSIRYSPAYAEVTINLTGANGQGQWRTNREAANIWHQSGETVLLPYSSYYEYSQIQFKDIPEWYKPDDSYIYLNSPEPQILTKAYTPIEYGYLKVIIEGRDGLGRWRTDIDTT